MKEPIFDFDLGPLLLEQHADDLNNNLQLIADYRLEGKTAQGYRRLQIVANIKALRGMVRYSRSQIRAICR